ATMRSLWVIASPRPYDQAGSGAGERVGEVDGLAGDDVAGLMALEAVVVVEQPAAGARDRQQVAVAGDDVHALAVAGRDGDPLREAVGLVFEPSGGGQRFLVPAQRRLLPGANRAHQRDVIDRERSVGQVVRGLDAKDAT